MTLRALLLAALLLAASATPARAQVLTGRVFDGVSGLAVPGAEVAVLGIDGTVVGFAVSDSTGAFGIEVPDAGHYAVTASVLGYDRLRVDSVEIGVMQDVRVELRLGPRPLDVAGLTVVARRDVGPPALRDYYRRLDRRNKTGRGEIVDREALDRHVAQTGARALVRESFHAREEGFGRDAMILVQRTSGRLGRDPWCEPAFFLNGVPVDGLAIRVIPASVLEGIELYRGAAEVPAEYSWPANALDCGVVLAWTRPGDGTGSWTEEELRPMRVGPYVAADPGADGPMELAAFGFEIERGFARSMVGWLEAGLVGAEPVTCPVGSASCGGGGVPWSLVVGATLFPTEDDLPLAPYLGGGFGMASPAGRVETAYLWRLGLEVSARLVRLRTELRIGPHGWGLGLGLLFF